MECLAFDDIEAQPMGFDGLPVHYMFRQENWLTLNSLPLHKGPWPLGLGRDSFWEASGLNLCNLN